MTEKESFFQAVKDLALRCHECEEKARKKTGLHKMHADAFSILEYIDTHENAVMGDVAKHTGKSLSSATVLVNPLVKQGYLCRYTGEQDRRRVIIEVTGKGRGVLKNYLKEREKTSAKLFRELDPQLIELLTKRKV